MPSTLELHKQSVRYLERVINDTGGVFVRGNYGRDSDPVGSFATVAGTIVPGGAQILASGRNYRLAHYGRRFAVAPELGRIEYQELRETDENWEEWVALYRWQV